MISFVCKTCGRAIRSEEKPNFCYHDRTTSIENISDDDSVKMQLFRGGRNAMAIFNSNFTPLDVEFPGDVKYDPFTGERIFGNNIGFTLSEYQDEIMSRVRA